MRSSDIEAVRLKLADLGRDWQASDVAAALRGLGVVVSDASVVEVVRTLRRTSIGAGPLDELLALDGVTDVLVNGPTQVWIDRGRGLELTQVVFPDEAAVRALAVRLAASVGRKLDDATPWVDARLRDGTRVHAVLSVLSDPGTCLSLRVPARRSFTFAELAEAAGMGPLMRQTLTAMMAQRVAFLVTGGTGSGKTTLLSALLGLVPVDERVVVVEDSRELNPTHPHVVRLEGRVANTEGVGRVSLTDLVRQCLRMRPDRIVLGEVRGAELVDLLMAMNTGHEGGCGTVHANSPADVPARLEALAALGGLDQRACQAQIASALDAVVHIERDQGGRRRVSQVGVVVRDADGGLRVNPAVVVHGDREQRGDGWASLAKKCRLPSRVAA